MGIINDIRFALRMLSKTPGFTAIAVLTLALGIGANTTIFSVVNAFLFRPPNLPEPERLVMISETNLRQGGQRDPTAALYDEWRRHSRLFEDIARGGFGADPGTLSGIGRAERITITYVTPNFFSMLNQKLHRGRGFLPGDAPSGQGVTAVISHDAWQRIFRADPNAVGQTVGLDGEKRTIVGVLPPGFSAVPWNTAADAWLVWNPLGNPGSRWLPVVGRVKPGVTVQQAQAELDAIPRQTVQARGATDTGWQVKVQDFHEAFVSGARGSLYLLLGSVGFVLLIACANVANLLLARAAARRREIAVRASLGAGRLRLLRQLLTESVLLAVLAGALGILVAVWGNSVFVTLAPPELGSLLSSMKIGIDLNVLAFTLGLSLFTGILFGLAPALHASKPNLNEELKETAGRAGGGSRQYGRSALVVSEVALALVLLVGAGLMINSFLRMRRVDLGFNPTNVLRADVFLNGPRYWQQLKGDKKRVTPQGALFYQQLLERVRTLPGVVSAAVTHLAPPGDVQVRSFKIIGSPGQPSQRAPLSHYCEVSDGFFRTLQVPLRSGRYLTDRDMETAPWVVVINETLARRYFPKENPIGRHVQLTILGGSSQINLEEDRPREIVGVVGDVRHFGFGHEMRPVMYGSYLQHVWEYPTGYYIGHLWKSIIIRTTSDPTKLAAPLQKIVTEIDKDQALFDIGTIEQKLAARLGEYGFLIRVFGIFGGLALLLAAVGIYGVMSYSVTQRTHEIGVRMTQGAKTWDVLRLVLKRGLTLALIGVAIGIPCSLALTTLIAGLLFGVKSTDPLTYVIVSLVLTAVATAACLVPARRATKVDPMVALRYE